MNKSEEYPIVSVVVVTYNSSKHILETLESIKAQTYPYLSIVITDDCSTDDTLKICKHWIDGNKGRFVDATIVESPVNTGVSANGNRGQRACRTKWVKGIAGDDILLPNCIQDNISYVTKYPDAIFLFSRYEPFCKVRGDFLSALDYSYFSLNPREQYDKLIFEGNCICAPTLFYNVEKTREIGLNNDERIPMMEDLPKWVNALKKGVQFHFFDKITVLWRYHQDSISSSHIDSPKYWTSKLDFYYLYQRPEYLSRFGEQKTIEMERENQIDIYKRYYECRRMLVVRFVFAFRMICRRIAKKIVGTRYH